MKKQLLFAACLTSVLSLASGCNKTTAEVAKDAIITDTEVDPIVRLDENGQLIKVNDPDNPENSRLSSITLNKQVVSLFYNERKSTYDSYQLSVSALPYGASTNGLIWASSDEAVATVDQTGKVTAVKEGMCNVTVKNFDGSVSATARVTVNDSRSITSNAMLTRANEIRAEQLKASFETENIYVEETYHSDRSPVGGKPESENSFTQKIWASDVHSYFRITSDDIEVKCEDGSEVPGRNDYIFYTTDDYFTYVFKTDGNKRNYMRIDQSSLAKEGKSKFDALSVVIGNFFVAGARIITQQFTLATGADMLTDSSIFGELVDGKYGRLQNVPGQMALTFQEQQKGRLSPDQAEDFDVPDGTYIVITDTMGCTWENNRVIGKSITEKIEFDLGDVPYADTIQVEYTIKQDNIELFYPDIKLYTKVDTIFDL